MQHSIETGLHALHGLGLLGFSVFIWRSSPARGIRYLAAAVCLAAVGPLSVAVAQILDHPLAAFFRWIAVPAAFGYFIFLIQSLIVLFRPERTAGRLVFGVQILFALLVTGYFYSDTYSSEPVRNAAGVFDFPPGAAAIAAGFAAFVYTVAFFIACFMPLFSWRPFRDAILLMPAGFLIVASIVLRGVLQVRTFAEDPHSSVLHASSALLSAGPLALYVFLAIGLRRRFESRNAGNALSE